MTAHLEKSVKLHENLIWENILLISHQCLSNALRKSILNTLLIKKIWVFYALECSIKCSTQCSTFYSDPNHKKTHSWLYDHWEMDHCLIHTLKPTELALREESLRRIMAQEVTWPVEMRASWSKFCSWFIFTTSWKIKKTKCYENKYSQDST